VITMSLFTFPTPNQMARWRLFWRINSLIWCVWNRFWILIRQKNCNISHSKKSFFNFLTGWFRNDHHNCLCTGAVYNCWARTFYVSCAVPMLIYLINQNMYLLLLSMLNKLNKHETRFRFK
jgi:hypothetical protein